MLELFLKIVVTIIIVIDPLGIVPVFISLTGRLEDARKKTVIRTALSISFVVLAIFILGGRYILRFMGISPGSFYVAGGVLFFLISLDMLFGQTKRIPDTAEESEDSHRSIAVFPLAIPLIAGPGMVTTIMLYSAGEYEPIGTTLMLFAAVLIALAAVWTSLSASSFLLRVLGRTGVSVIERMMGLLLSALAVQFVYDGLSKLGVIAHP